MWRNLGVVGFLKREFEGEVGLGFGENSEFVESGDNVIGRVRDRLI